MKWLPAGLWLTLFLLAFLLRLQSMSEPLWLDELHTSWVVSGRPGDVHQRAWEGNQMPLYYWLVWPVAKLTGGSPFGLRLISFVASAGTVLSLGWIVFGWKKSHFAALLVAALASIDDKFLFYSAEARPYALLQLVGLWQLTWFVKGVHGSGQVAVSANPVPVHGARHCAWLAVLMLWLQPTTVVLLASEALFLLVALVRKKDFLPAIRFASHRFELLFIVLMAAWPLVAAWLLVENSNRWLRFVDPARMSLGVIADILVWNGIPLLAALMLPRGQAGAKENAKGGYRARALFAICSFAIAASVMSTFSRMIPLAEYRYLIVPVTGLLLSGGMIVCGLPAAWRCRVAVLIMALAIASNPLLPGFCDTGRLPAQRVEDWNAIVEKINTDNAPICFFPNLVEDEVLVNKSPTDIHPGQRDDYFLFALSGTGRLKGLDDNTRVCEAFSVIARSSPSKRLQSAIAVEKGYWILIRARPEDAKQAVEAVNQWPETQFAVKELEDDSIPPLNLFRVRLNTVN